MRRAERPPPRRRSLSSTVRSTCGPWTPPRTASPRERCWRWGVGARASWSTGWLRVGRHGSAGARGPGPGADAGGAAAADAGLRGGGGGAGPLLLRPARPGRQEWLAGLGLEQEPVSACRGPGPPGRGGALGAGGAPARGARRAGRGRGAVRGAGAACPGGARAAAAARGDPAGSGPPWDAIRLLERLLPRFPGKVESGLQLAGQLLDAGMTRRAREVLQGADPSSRTTAAGAAAGPGGRELRAGGAAHPRAGALPDGGAAGARAPGHFTVARLHESLQHFGDAARSVREGLQLLPAREPAATRRPGWRAWSRGEAQAPGGAATGADGRPAQAGSWSTCCGRPPTSRKLGAHCA